MLIHNFARGQAVVPGKPTPLLNIRTGSEILVDITPPTTDGGAEITSYVVDWDTKPGVREIQALQTSVYLEPNEIQTVATTASHVDEVQIIATSTADVDEVQTISLSVELGITLGGSFSVIFDDSSTGGSAQESGSIMVNAAATGSAHISMEEILEAMPNVGDVTVTRSGVAGAYVWTIEFVGNERNIPQLRLGSSSLTGAGADVAFATTTQGNQLGGSFAITFDSKTSEPINYDASAAAIKATLEKLSPSIGTVDVSTLASNIDAQWGRSWRVTFTSDTNKGDVVKMGVEYTGLSGTSAKAFVCADAETAGDCSSHTTSIQGNQLGGTFTLADGAGNLATINHDSSVTDFKTAIEALAGVGTVSVSRTAAADINGGYTWTVSFTDFFGDHFDLVAAGAGSTLSGVGAAVTVVEVAKGTLKEIQTVRLSGTKAFTLGFGSDTTLQVPFPTLDICNTLISTTDANLELLPSIDSVTIACAQVTGEYELAITFNTAAGSLNLLETTFDDNSVANAVRTQTATSTVLGGQFTASFRGERTGYLNPLALSAAELKAALEGLTTIGTVDVTRSTVDENNGYTWSVTFLTEMGDIPLMVTDTLALTGTANRAIVSEQTKGVEPPFDGSLDGTLLPLGSATASAETAEYKITGLRQGVPYYVRTSARNLVGTGLPGFSVPRYLAPLANNPSPPVAVNLSVVDGYNLNVSWSAPLLEGGHSIDAYRIELDAQALVPEVQAIQIKSTPVNEVKTVTTTGNDVNEVQVVKVVGTGDGTTVVEIQTVNCDASGGTIRFTFDGQQTAPVAYDATLAQVKSALEDLSSISSVTVLVASGGTQTTICRPVSGVTLPDNIEITFNSHVGDAPMLVADLVALTGNKIVTIAQNTQGKADADGTFKLSFGGGALSSPISVTADATQFQAALDASNVLPAGYTVVRSGPDTGNLYTWTVTLTDTTLQGDVPFALEVDSVSLAVTGNGVGVVVCTDGNAQSPCGGTSVRGNTLGGTFTLSLLGHTTADINANAAASSVKAAIDALPNVGTVTVVRAATPDTANAYGRTWTITFTSMPAAFPKGSGNVDTMTVDFGKLTGAGASASVDNAVTQGSTPLGGTFTLAFDSDGTGSSTYTTSPIPSTASASLVKQELEKLQNIGRVAVTRAVDGYLGYTFRVTFAGCGTRASNDVTVCNVGDLRPLVANGGALTGNAAAAEVTEVTQGTGFTGSSTLHPSEHYFTADITDLSGSNGNFVYTLGSLQAGLTYYVRVSAHNSCFNSCAGCCGWSLPQVSYPLYQIPANQQPGPPPAPRLVNSSATSVSVSWGAPRINGGAVVTGYQLWMDDWQGGGFDLIYHGPDRPNELVFNTAAIRALDPQRQYRFKARTLKRYWR